ncbi:MAG: FtsX-like permease family protein [Prevotellaceae bacterium]|nr:FtsX-like permease family protein [Candidatus Faecinaster equi]
MSFPFYIAKRYLFSKKKHHAINIISIISMVGIMVATIALVCTLSVFNGFQDLVGSLFTTFDPELKVVSAGSKTFRTTNSAIIQAMKHPEVESASLCLEDKALARYNGNQQMITLKGVDDNYQAVTSINDILYGQGAFILHADVIHYAVPGLRLAVQLGMDRGINIPLEIYTPRPGEKVDMLNPTESFNADELLLSEAYFSVNQKKYDEGYLLTSLAFTQHMFEKPNQASSLELKLKEGVNIQSVQKKLQNQLGNQFKVLNRYQQQEDVFKIMKIEKYMAYIFLTFILFIACFNIIGSLSMLIIDKKEDVATLYNLGASNKQISQIFLYEGRLISILGAILGIVIGLALCYAQQELGLLKMGDQSGVFIVDAYPVCVQWGDILLILVTVVAVSFVASWYPVKYLSRRLLQ